MTRSIPPSLSPVLTELELEAPEIVSLAQLTELMERTEIGTEPKVVADRLRRLGWLLPTATSGVFEFCPAAHAGAIGHGDPFLELRAALAIHPSLPAAVCLSSALAASGLVERAPNRLEVAVDPHTRVPLGLSRAARVVRFHSHLDPDQSSGVPVHQPATVLAHIAERPVQMRSWGTIADNLADILDAVDPADVESEMAGRPRSVSVRLAYLLQGVAPDLADHLAPPEEGGRDAPKIWFGPRGPLRRHSTRFSVADTLLPFDPAALRPLS